MFIRLISLIKSKAQFICYAFVGLFATLLDWSIFYILTYLYEWDYLLAVSISTLLGGSSKFLINKFFTFKSTSNRYAHQFLIFVLITVIAILLGMGLMYLFVNLFGLNKMLSRIVSTFMVLFVNYFLDRNFTFNKRYFSDGV